MNKRFLSYIFLIIINVSIIFYSLFYGIPQNIERIITLVLILIFLLIAFFGILSYFEPTLARSFKWFTSFLRVYNKIITVLSLILLARIVFAIVYYGIYLNDPSKIKFDDPVAEQNVIQVEHNLHESISKINKEKSQLGQHLKNVDHFIVSVKEYKSRSDIDSIWRQSRMLMTDSIFC